MQDKIKNKVGSQNVNASFNLNIKTNTKINQVTSCGGNAASYVPLFSNLLIPKKKKALVLISGLYTHLISSSENFQVTYWECNLILDAQDAAEHDSNQ